MLRELALIFFRLGIISFGGPVAHIALMQREFVERRGWISNQEFLDLAGAMSLIPGPNSTELTMAIGRRRAGNKGLWIAGAAFILPAFAIVFALSIAYAKYGQLPLSRALLYGVQPVVIAIIVQALGKLAPTALKNPFTYLLALSAFAAALSGRISEVVILFAAALLGLLAGWLQRPKNEINPPQVLAEQNDESITPKSAPLLVAGALWGSKTSFLFWSFLKIGAILYGSGYVLLAFLRDAFVPRYLTDTQLIDAVAIGQMTPGPVFTTATFVGYQIGGASGAIAATIGIFLPSFLLVKLLLGTLERAKNKAVLRWILDAVNAASLALMASVTLQLGRAALIDYWTLSICLISWLLLHKTRINSAWFIAGGALAGWLVLRLG